MPPGPATRLLEGLSERQILAWSPIPESILQRIVLTATGGQQSPLENIQNGFGDSSSERRAFFSAAFES